MLGGGSSAILAAGPYNGGQASRIAASGAAYTGLAIDSAGHIYAGNSATGQILQYLSDGTTRKLWHSDDGSQAEMGAPSPTVEDPAPRATDLSVTHGSPYVQLMFAHAPVWAASGHAGIEDHDAWRIPTADRAEVALVAGAGDDLAENVIYSVSLGAAFVDRIDNEVGGRQR